MSSNRQFLQLPQGRMFYQGAFLLLLLAFTSCSGQTNNKKAGQVFLQTYGGNPYMGTVQVDVIRPDGSHAKTDYGEGSAHFVDSGRGKAKMVLFGAIKDKKGDAGFAVDGECNEKSWKSEAGIISLAIGPDGKITGGGTKHPQQFQFTGTISRNRLELVTRLKLLQQAGEGQPAGLTYVFRYNLRRDVDETPTAKRKCDKIVWKTQYVANFDGSATTVRIPHCVSN